MRVRIVDDIYNGYELQFRYKFWPFWCQAGVTPFSTIEKAEEFARKRLARKTFVKEVFLNRDNNE